MKLSRILLYSLLIFLFLWGIYFYRWIFGYLICAVIFAFILNPWVSWLERRGISRVISILIVYLGIGGVIAWSMFRVLPLLINQAENLLSLLQSSSEEGEVSLLKIAFIQGLYDRILHIHDKVPILNLPTHFVNIINGLNTALKNIPDFLLNN